MPFCLSGAAMMAAMVRRGLSDDIGSWKIICRSRRSGFSAVLRQDA